MRKAHEGVATQFGLGVSQAALVVGERIGYELRSLVPVYVRVLRAGYWMRTGGSSAFSRGLRLARDIASRWVQRSTARRATIVLETRVRVRSRDRPDRRKGQGSCHPHSAGPDAAQYDASFSAASR